jgi:hypothetical protein
MITDMAATISRTRAALDCAASGENGDSTRRLLQRFNVATVQRFSGSQQIPNP